MRKRKLKKRIRELEKRVIDLEQSVTPLLPILEPDEYIAFDGKNWIWKRRADLVRIGDAV